MDTIKTRMTVEEFSQLPETNLPTELIDGEIVMTPAPEDYHQELVLNIGEYLKKLTEKKGHVRVSPIDVRLGENNSVQPDVMWVSGADSLCQREPNAKRWRGAPDLVCEILSAGTAKHDRYIKFSLYEKHGTREYWLIDPLRRSVEVFARQDEKLVLVDVYQEAFVSPLLQKSVETDILFDSSFDA